MRRSCDVPKRGEAGACAGAAAGKSDTLGGSCTETTSAFASTSVTPRRVRQLGYRPGRSIPQRAQRGLQDDQQDMNPLMRLALAHTEQPPLHDLERIGLQVDQDKQPPILRRGQGTVLVGGVPPGGARLSIRRHAPIWAWKLTSNGGTNGRNSSSVRLVKSSTSVGRVWRSMNRHVPMAVASFRWRPRLS